MSVINRPNGATDGRGHRLALILGTMMAVLAFGAVAPAATLGVRGPAGAELFVDGQRIGVLPLGEPVPVEPGLVVIECRKPGHLVHRETLTVEGPETELSVELELQALSRRRALGSSLALAGLGQLYQGRPRMGWTMVALQGSAWLLAAAAEGAFQSSRDDFEVLDRRYQDAILETEVVALRKERDAAYDDLESARNLRTTALGAVVVIGVWSLFDVWRAHGGFFADAEVPALAGNSPATNLESTQWRLGWRANF